VNKSSAAEQKTNYTPIYQEREKRQQKLEKIETTISHKRKMR